MKDKERWNWNDGFQGFWKRQTKPPFSVNDELRHLDMVQQVFGQNAENDDYVAAALLGLKNHMNSDTQFLNLKKELARFKVEQDRKVPFDDPGDISGDIITGYTMPGKGTARILIQALTNHSLLVANSGAGKTILFMFLILQLNRLMPCWVFDFFKREYRLVLGKPGAGSISVLRWEWLRMNVLAVPKGVEPVLWISNAVEILCCALDISFVSASMLHGSLFSLYQKHGILSGGMAYPTLDELIPSLKDVEGHPGSRQAIISRLKPMIDTMGDVFSRRSGIDIEKLAGHSIIFELDGLPQPYQNVLLFYLLMSIFAQRVTGSQKNLLGLFLDEGHRVYADVGKGPFGGRPYISQMTSIVRGMSICLFAAVQYLKGIDDSIIENSAFKIIGRLGSTVGMEGFAGLSGRQLDYWMQHAVAGTFIGQLGYGTFRKPYLFTVPLVELPEHISESRVTAGKDLVSTLLLPDSEVPVIDVGNADTGSSTDDRTEEKDEETYGLSPDESGLLEFVWNHPGQPSTSIYKALGWSARKGIAVRKKLIDKGFLEERREGRKILLVVTPEGKAWVKV